ncbi:MAG TPA: hypothetical protein PLW70_07825 [Bacteroidales bacterium]|nr:hypothetical protein [Bacteroidales bacterium]
MKNLIIITITAISLSYSLSLSAQKTKIANNQSAHTSFDWQQPIHSMGLLFSLNSSFIQQSTSPNEIKVPLHSTIYFRPECILRYSYVIKNGWGITVEIPFGEFRRYIHHGHIPQHIADSLQDNGIALGYKGNELGVNSYYLGFSLKASHLANVHKNIALQSEVGLKWLPFLKTDKKLFDNATGDFTDYSGDVYMNCTPTLSTASYAVPDLAFSFNVLVHGKNPAHNFVFGINANLGLMDRVHFKYQTTNSLPTHLQSSGEFGWRMSSIGLHIGYQWMTMKK